MATKDKDSETLDRLKEELFSLIERTMEKDEITQGEVARRLGTHRTNINMAMRRKFPVTLDFLVRVAECIGIKVVLKTSK